MKSVADSLEEMGGPMNYAPISRAGDDGSSNWIAIDFFDVVIQSYIPLPAEWYTQTIPLMREVLFGVALILVLMFRPSGLFGTKELTRV